MKNKYIILLILSVFLSNCTIHKKKYSRGFTIEKNNSFKAASKKEKKSLSNQAEKIKAEVTSPSNSTLTQIEEQYTSEPVEEKENTYSSDFYENKLNKDLNLPKEKLVPTKVLNEIIVPPDERGDEEEEEVDNIYATTGLVIFSIGVILTSLILSTATSGIIIILLITLSFLSLYVLTVKSFKEIRTKKVRNKWVTSVNIGIITIILAASISGLLLIGLFSLYYLETVLILLILAGILLLALLLFITLFSFIRSIRSRK